MNIKRSIQNSIMCCAVLLALGSGPSSEAAQANVDVFSFGYNPASTNINVGDSVLWTWTGSPHSVTSSTGAWTDTGLQNSGFTFSHAFNTSGTFPYFCTLHSVMQGSVTVNAATTNQPPTVTITNPASGATFAAPWTGTVKANASDPDADGVARVQFFTNSVSAGIVSNAPYNLTLSSVAAGNYSLKAVALDNGGATGTSAPVSITVVAPVPIVITDPLRLPSGQFRFTYSANTGLTYVVQRGTELTNLMGIITSVATNSSVHFTDNTPSVVRGFYRVGRLPNP